MENSTKPDYVIGYPLPAGEFLCNIPPEKETKPPPPAPAPAAAAAATTTTTITTNERTNCRCRFDNSTVEFLILLTIFLFLSGIVLLMVVLDRTDSFPIPIKIEIESFNVSSLNLNLSPPSPSITANWSVAFSGKNVNWKLTKSLEDVKAIVLYHGEFVCEANVAPLQLRAGQDGAWRVNLTSAAEEEERVKPWVVKNIAADRIRDDAVLFDFRLEGLDVRSSKKKHKLVYGRDQIEFGFSGNSSSGYGSFLYGPTRAIIQ